MDTLIRNWWMVAIRGALAAAFGLSIMLSPRAGLSWVVDMFGAYAILDGVWAIASVAVTSRRLYEAWPVVAEGLAGLVLGSLALAWPFVPARVIVVVAAWGIFTGILDIVVAARLPRTRAGHWLLGTAGAFSIFLAGVLLMLPRTDALVVEWALGTYAVVFGTLVMLTAAGFRGARGADVPGPGQPGTLPRASS